MSQGKCEQEVSTSREEDAHEANYLLQSPGSDYRYTCWTLQGDNSRGALQRILAQMKTEAQSGYVTYTVSHSILTLVLELCLCALGCSCEAPIF